MKINPDAVRKCLISFDFKTLFREHLGWDNHQAQMDIPINGNVFRLTGVAHKRGFAAFICPSIPDRSTRLKIDHQVTKSAREHFVIYADQSSGKQVWQWVRREPNKPHASREQRFDIRQSGEPLIQRLDLIAISIEEEEEITVVDVVGRTRAAFDVDRVTRRFYDHFKIEHAAFLQLIKGIKTDVDLQWYTSLMLNRLMFVYFIQKKGFLDGDTNYLRNRLVMIQQARGKDKFQSFYRYFLLRLFHDGLGMSPDERKLDPVMDKLLGKVPFLNGGFFEVHEIEQRYTDIDIPDNAFEKLFDFFDRYSWHLDERTLRVDNEINPDVVGYIFEKYINQKQMGAYYTQEDITNYISKCTVIPFIFDAAKNKCPVAFEPDSALWRLLRDNPDRYIYPAVRHGVISSKGLIIPESELPDFVQMGMHDPNARMHDDRYNLHQAPDKDPIRLMKETWREYAFRRQRCLDVREKFHTGEISQIHDLITLNIDIWQFARDAIINADDPDLLRAFWHAIERITVLDPTCGSGAFLFAALRILETLYSDCLERMGIFIGEISDKLHSPEQYSDFKKIRGQISKHPNERYFILKSIVINNLFGVDIMEEAVEICKLRLFLKLIAQVESVDQIEPLPDIDFNIRSGNALVGFASLEEVRKSQQGTLGFGMDHVQRIEDEAEIFERKFRKFRDQQIISGGKVAHKDKQELRSRLKNLGAELDRYMAGEYGVNVDEHNLFDAWKASYKPFHWFVEFYGFMNSGGFDVIIGNPPYLEIRQVNYIPRQFQTYDTGAIHAMCVERSLSLLQTTGAISMIVPLGLTSTQRMTVVQHLIEKHSQTWYANFAWRPGKLFDTVNRALTIFVGYRGKGVGNLTYSTNYQKWHSDTRGNLIPTITYCEVDRERPAFWVPKLKDPLERSILSKMLASPTQVSSFIGKSNNFIYYRTTGGLYWKVFTDFAPSFKCDGKPGHSSRETTFALAKAAHMRPIIAVLSSDLFWWWYTVTSNLRDLNPSDIMGFPVPSSLLSDIEIAVLGDEYLSDLKRNSTMLVRQQRRTGKTETQMFEIKKSKPIIERIDNAMSHHYGLTMEELDYIKNYDIKYRIGASGEDGDE